MNSGGRLITLSVFSLLTFAVHAMEYTEKLSQEIEQELNERAKANEELYKKMNSLSQAEREEVKKRSKQINDWFENEKRKRSDKKDPDEIKVIVKVNGVDGFLAGILASNPDGVLTGALLRKGLEKICEIGKEEIKKEQAKQQKETN